MTSDFPASSSSQQPFANPQPAPVPSAAQAASPPTKQSLKNWLKTFRPPQKNPEPNGKPPRFSSPKSFRNNPSLFAKSYSAKLHNERTYTIKESSMDEETLAIDGLPDDGEVLDSPCVKKRFPYNPASILSTEQASSRRHSAFVPGSAKKELRPQRSRSMLLSAPSRQDVSAKRASWHASATQVVELQSSEPLGTSKPPKSKGNSLSKIIVEFFRASFSSEQNTKSATIVQPPTGIFGVPLRQSITYANVAISLVDAEGRSYIYGYVPIVVAKCGVYLKEKATNVEGIFRLSGSEKRIKELRLIFDSPDRYGKGLDWAGYTVHDAANVLRRYLNQLPEPIVPLDLYERFREPLKGHTKQAVGDSEGTQLADNFDVAKAISTYQQLITELPPLNRQLLLYILDLLAVFASKSDENRMNSQNLAAIFQPGMLSHPQHDMAPSEYRLSQDVLIFLIENQDHFLIGMRGTAADEQTVQEVQNGGTPSPGMPSTPGRSKNVVARSASNASAGADSVRKFGGVRRNVSVSSKHSRQSNGAPSPASPAYGAALTNTSSGGLGRSNTVPSKRSPGLPSTRLQKNSGSPSPTTTTYNIQHASPRGLSPSAGTATQRNPSPSSALTAAPGTLSLAPSSPAASTVTSQERLLSDAEAPTPTSQHNVSNLFQRSPTVESDKRQPNKLRKKQRVPSSSNPSAQSSTQSLNSHPPAVSPGLQPVRDVAEHPHLESIPSSPGNPTLSHTESTPPPLTDTPETEQPSQVTPRPDEIHHQASDRTLKPASPVSSVHSHSSYNDPSDQDHHPDEAAAADEQIEKRSRWRLSRHRDNSQSLGHNLTPRKGLGSNSVAGASTSSIGSSRPRKSFTGDTIPASSDSTLVGTLLQSSNESGSATGLPEEKKGPLGWIKNKMREKREEKDAEKDRNKSPPASTERLPMSLPFRGKSMDVRRDDRPEQKNEEAAVQQPPR